MGRQKTFLPDRDKSMSSWAQAIINMNRLAPDKWRSVFRYVIYPYRVENISQAAAMATFQSRESGAAKPKTA
jgi:hypothetical protein